MRIDTYELMYFQAYRLSGFGIQDPSHRIRNLLSSEKLPDVFSQMVTKTAKHLHDDGSDVESSNSLCLDITRLLRIPRTARTVLKSHQLLTINDQY